jgi:ankyrin repeat protein
VVHRKVLASLECLRHAAYLRTLSLSRDIMEYSEFFELIIKGHLTEIKEAVKLGYKINLPDQYGFLPIHRACANNKPQIASFLIESGSDINSEKRGQSLNSE